MNEVNSGNQISLSLSLKKEEELGLCSESPHGGDSSEYTWKPSFENRTGPTIWPEKTGTGAGHRTGENRVNRAVLVKTGEPDVFIWARNVI